MTPQTLNIVNVTMQEKVVIYSALSSFLNAHPEFRDQLNEIKITRKKYPADLTAGAPKIRKVFFPLVNNNGTIVQCSFSCPVDSEDTFSNDTGHSCTFENHHGRIKMICPQNKQEETTFKYYQHRTLINSKNEVTSKFNVKRAAVYDYLDLTWTKKEEIVYKSTLKRVRTRHYATLNYQILTSMDLYWSSSIYTRFKTIPNNRQYRKTIELMIDAGNNTTQIPSTYCHETIAWKILIALAELQARRLIHSDIKPHNICYTPYQDSVSSNSNVMVIRFIDLDDLHLENTTDASVYTPGYLAPELFNPNEILSPHEQKACLATQIDQQLNQNAIYTLATDLFAMAQTLKIILTGYSLSNELQQLIAQMESVNPADRPDLAHGFKLTSERNPALAEYIPSNSQLIRVRFWGNINRILTLTNPHNPELADKIRKHIYNDRYFHQNILKIENQLHTEWLSPHDIYHLVYPSLRRQLYDAITNVPSFFQTCMNAQHVDVHSIFNAETLDVIPDNSGLQLASHQEPVNSTESNFLVAPQPSEHNPVGLAPPGEHQVVTPDTLPVRITACLNWISNRFQFFHHESLRIHPYTEDHVVNEHTTPRLGLGE